MVTTGRTIGPAVVLALGIVGTGAGLLVYHVSAARPQTAATGEVKKPAAPWETEQFKRLKLEMTQRELIQLQADLRKIQLELKYWEEREPTFKTSLPIPASAIEERLNQDPMIAGYLSRIRQLDDQIVENQKVLVPAKAAEAAKALEVQKAALAKSVEEEKLRARKEVEKQLREKALDEFHGKLIEYREQVEIGKKREEGLKAELVQLSKEVSTPSAASDPRVAALEQEVRQLKEAVEELKKKK
jgi:hypothetical protein